MRISAFDGLRGILATAVVLSHVSVMTYFPGVASQAPDLFGYLTWYLGAPAVDAFFVLSGYVVALSAQRHAHLGSFYLARLRRLAPLALFGALLAFVAVRPLADLIPVSAAPGGILPSLRLPVGVSDVVGVLTLGLAGWYDANRLHPPLWTMAVEAYASVLTPLMVFSLRHLGWGALLSWGLVAWIFSLLFWPLFLMPAFVLGAALALRPPRVPRPALIPLALVGAALLLCRHLIDSNDLIWRWPAAVGAALLLVALRDLDPAWLRARPAQWLGERSFALYVTHFPVLLLGAWSLGPLIGIREGALVMVPWCLLVAHWTNGAQGALARLRTTSGDGDRRK